MPSISILVYNDGKHREHVASLWKTVFGYEAPHNEPSLVIDQKLAVKDNLFFVATDREQVIGSIMAGYDGHRGWIYSLAVSPDHRHAGIGSALVCHAEQALQLLGCLKINLQVVTSNAQVIAFYETLGYQVEPRVSMGKLIKAEL